MTPSRRRSHRFLLSLLVFAAFVLLFLAYIGVIGGNVRTVVPGRVFRSAQLTGKTLGSVLDADRIRTVINLRGGADTEEWYRSERQECDARGVQHFDIPMSARVLPPPDRLQALLNAFDHASYPILFHCRSGADRSGLTGALYLNIYAHVPLDEALHRQLTWHYGHFSFGVSHAMNDFFALYQKTGEGMPLRQWITTRYPALYVEQTGDRVLPVAVPSQKRTATPSKHPQKQTLQPAP